jgi:DNA-binding transcriptional MerR regulator
VSALQPQQLLSIGDVLKFLKPEFSDISISKIRFLETEGLVEPQRTASGYRKYSHADIARLRYVLSLQRDQYMPLRVIKERLDALDRGLEPDEVNKVSPRALVSVDSLPTAQDFVQNAPLRLTSIELLEASNAEKSQLDQAKEFGLISASAEAYNADDVAVLKSIVALGKYGIEPRHLRPFKIAAERELGLITQVVSTLAHQKDPELAQQAQDVARDIAALSVGLHSSLVRAGLSQLD